MSASVFRGPTRPLPRWTVALVVLGLTAGLVVRLATESAGGGTRTEFPAFFGLFFGNPPLDAAAGLLVAFALVQFGRRRRPLLWGTVALAGAGFLCEAVAILRGGQNRETFTGGAVLFGWLFGLLYARALRRFAPAGTPVAEEPHAEEPYAEEPYAEAGAAGAFVAIYLGAVTSKLTTSGLHWADGAQLLSPLLSRHPLGHGPVDAFIGVMLRHPVIATGFATTTLVIQAGAVLYLVSPRLRMAWGALILAFHVGTFVLMDVRYVAPMFLALGFSFPWPALLARLRGRPPSAPEPAPPSPGSAPVLAATRLAAGWLAMIAGVVVALWLALHWNDPYRRDPNGERHGTGGGAFPAGPSSPYRP